MTKTPRSTVMRITSQILQLKISKKYALLEASIGRRLYARIDELTKLSERMVEEVKKLKKENQKVLHAQMDTIDAVVKMSEKFEKKFEKVIEELESPKKSKTDEDARVGKLSERMVKEVQNLGSNDPSEIEDLKEQIVKVLHAQMDAIDAVVKMSKELKSLKKQQDKRKILRRLGSRPVYKESSSSESDSTEKAVEETRLQVRKTRRQRKEDLKKKQNGPEKKPEEVEELPSITQQDFGLKNRCAWCWRTDHSPDDCSNYNTLEERNFIINRRFLCNLCLVFHPGQICFVSPPCPHCPEKGHYPAICPSEAHQLLLEQLP